MFYASTRLYNIKSLLMLNSFSILYSHNLLYGIYLHVHPVWAITIILLQIHAINTYHHSITLFSLSPCIFLYITISFVFSITLSISILPGIFHYILSLFLLVFTCFTSSISCGLPGHTGWCSDLRLCFYTVCPSIGCFPFSFWLVGLQLFLEVLCWFVLCLVPFPKYMCFSKVCILCWYF